MKKGFVKILNLVYLAAACTSTFLIATQPILDINIGIHLSSKQIGDVVSKAMGGAESAEGETKAIKRGEGDELDLKSMLTGDKIAEAFGDDGFSLEIPLKVEAKYAYKLKRTDVLDIVINDNIDNILDKAITSLTTPLNKLIRNVTSEFATSVLSDQIAEQLDSYFVGVDVKTEDVSEIFDNVFDLLDNDGGEPVTVDKLSDTIMGEPTEFALANPQPEESTFGNNIYYVKDGETYTKATEFASGTQYYVATKYSAGVYSIFMDAQNASAEYLKVGSVVDGTSFDDAKATYTTLYKKTGENQYEEITAYDESVSEYFRKTSFAKDDTVIDEATFETAKAAHQLYKKNGSTYVQVVDFEAETEYYYETSFSMADVNPDLIHDAMVDALANIPGLVNTEYESAGTPADEVAFDALKLKYEKLFTKVGDEYQEATEYAPETEYFYIGSQTISSINDALIGLLNGLGGSSEPAKAIKRAEGESQSSEDALNEKIKDFVLDKIPLDSIKDVTANFGDKAPLILLGVIVLFALPWAWFALVTLFRTLRKNKFWTRPGIVFFWAFPQLILGVGLMLVGKFGVPFAVKMLGDKVALIGEYGSALSLNLTTGVLIPSFIYLGMIPFTIFYKIVAHSAKREYKINKKMKKAAKRAA